ncbi:MAG: DUF3710 domain-containing protein [Actinobacteria bacterium]|nr:DUF3710 domain-containing protein [Actinomycetota bacterium]MCA1719718.1 DUF3710 domain-containing protein [Actinomycetota bacterium]
MFGRKKNDEDDLEEYALSPEDQALEDAELLAIIDAQLANEPETAAEPTRPQGPWDSEDAPEDDLQRIDLGALLVPVPEGTEVRVDVSPEGEVVAATLVQGENTMQVNAFAAPRRSGIWGEVRAEIAEALNGGGGSAQEADGPYGTELHAQVPAEVPGQGVQLAPARFLGVDGPRWFLRALIAGPGATDPAAAAGLEQVLRDVVVVRGFEAMAVRDPLPLRLPADVTDAAEAAAAEQARLDMPERGPEITETR